MTPTPKILLNAGMSIRGWSFKQQVLMCPQEWSYSRALGYRTETEPLVRGSLVHLGFAHYRARVMAAQNGWDPDAYYQPDVAIDILAEREDDRRIDEGQVPMWRKLAPQAELTVQNRRAHDLVEGMPQIIAVEHLLGGWFDEVGMVDPPADADARMRLMAGGPAEWAVLARLGGPYYHSARADWIYKQAGYYWIGDTKTAYKIDRTKIDGYAMSGQVHGLTWFGMHAYGEKFGGISIDFAVMSTQKFPLHRMPYAPGAVRDFPQTVVDAEERIAGLLQSGRPFDRYPKTLNEQSCVRRYGPRCPHYEFCRLGGPDA
jgi:hypothetical protein